MLNATAKLAQTPHIRLTVFALKLGLMMAVVMLLATPAFGQTNGEDTPTAVGPFSGTQDIRPIAEEHLPDERVSVPQFMLAFVERNPEAFVGGNVNLLREGVVLEVPTTEEALALESDEAARRLDEQMQWFAGLPDQERMELIEIAKADPVAIDPPDPAREPEEEVLVPRPEPALESEEALDEPDAVPEPAPVEPDPAPEAPDLVPEPDLASEPEVAIVDEVPEPDPIFEPAPTEPESELVPEAPERSPDEMFEPDADPVLDPTRDADLPAAEQDLPAEPAPPVPGPDPAVTPPEAAPWWIWVVGGVVLLLVLLMVFRIAGRRGQ